jgi:hypothetical protein
VPIQAANYQDPQGLPLGVLRLAGQENGSSVAKRSPRLALGSSQANWRNWTTVMSAGTGRSAMKLSSKVKNAWKAMGVSAKYLKLPSAILGDLRIEGSIILGHLT